MGDVQSTVAPNLTRRLGFGLALGFVVILGLLLLGDLRQVSERVLAFRWQLAPAILGLTLFNYTLRFFKWHFYLIQVGVRDFPLKESARLFVAGFPLSITPGKVGEALKAVWLEQKTGLPLARGLAVVLAERISDGLAMVGLSTLGVIAYPQYWPAFVLVACLLVGLVVVTQIRPLALALLRFGERLPLVKRFSHSLLEFYEGSYVLFRPGATLLATGLGIVSWLCEGLGFYIILLGLGFQASWKLLAVAVFSLAFSTIVGAASTLPGGLGAAEASIAGMLTFMLAASPDLSSAATLLVRLFTFWFGVALGLGAWAISPDLLGMTKQKEIRREEAT
jgi:uncharacterized protein (TIRG00374 family)